MSANRALEGLAAILAKQPIIPTFKAREFWDSAPDVEAAYERHVRSYIPLARGGSGEEGVDVAAFEGKLVDSIRKARAPLGYVVGEYGHGKTSTGLFLWQRAREANLVAVPPFSFDALEDLVTAVAGWVRFSVERVRPGLGARAEQIYEQYRREGLEGLARTRAEKTGRPYEEVLDDLRDLDREGRLLLGLRGLDYVNFLEEMTRLALEAGYQGLLVVADEVQQYIEHEDVTSAREPVADLFDLINAMYTRAGRLACGLMFLLPNKELGFLNEQRGDLVGRMRSSRLALDLGLVHGADFASRLWQRIADEFEFAEVAPRVIDADALRALGEIAVRTDLASGPRTVVDVIKIAVQRYLDGGQRPYGLLDLVESFERGEVTFDAVSKVRAAVRHALAHDLVRGHSDRERAVRLMAAFPTTGLTEDLQAREGVREACDDLLRLSVGDLVALRGGGLDHEGKVVKAGVTLKELAPPDLVVSWLKATIRTFRLDYYLGSEKVQRLAVEGFRSLLGDRLFPGPSWRVESENQGTHISQNRGVVFRGSFPSFARQFPDRLVYCRLLAPRESIHEVPPGHDILIDFALRLPLDQPPDRQREDPGRLVWVAANHARVELNLLHRKAEASYVELSPGFEDIVAPYEVNPLLTLSLFSELSRHLAAGRIPGSEAPLVRDQFLPSLLSAALRDLFGPGLGQNVEPQVPAAEARFVETLCKMLCERTYGDEYVTLMVSGQWQAALRRYRGALDRTNHPLVRRGQERCSGTKTEIAELFGLSNPAFDTFVQTFPQLITVEEQFRGNSPGAVRFTLHPLEHRIQQTVERGQKVLRLDPRTQKRVLVPQVALSDVFRELTPLGYRQAEIDEAVDLLEARQMIQRDLTHGLLIALEPDVPSLEEVRRLLEAAQARLTTLRPALDSDLLATRERELVQYLTAAERQSLTPQQLIDAKRRGERVSVEIGTAVEARRPQLVAEAARLAQGGGEDDRLSSALTQPASGGLFVDSLNVVRVSLLQEVTALRSRGDRARQVARETKAQLEQSGLTDEALVASLKRLREAHDALELVRQQRETLSARIASYRDAERLLQEATSLLNEKLLLLGSPVSGQRDELDAWARDVRGALMAHRVEALRDVESWRARFQTIKQQVDDYERARKEEFGDRQRVLRGLLVGYFQVKPETLPAFTYNPVDPEESYRLLVQQFRETLAKVQQAASQKLDEEARRARNLLAPETLELLPLEERPRATADMREVEHEVARIQAAMSAGFARLADLVEADGSISAEQLEAQAQAIGLAGQPVAALHERVLAFERLLRETTLTPDETRARSTLVDLASRAAGGQVDFREFERRVKQEVGTADPWQLLKALVTKSRAAVHIRVVGQ